MKTVCIILAGCLAVSAAGGTAGERKKLESFWPDGTVKMLGQVKQMPDGELVNDGRFTTWFENGQKQSEEIWKDGIREGPARYWNEHGNLIEQKYFRAGEPHGRLVTYWPNGKAKIEQTYQEGTLSGQETRWYSDGRKAVEGQWTAGKRDGTWRYWNRHGELLQTRTYENGQLAGATYLPSRRGRDGVAFDPKDFEAPLIIYDPPDISDHRVYELPTAVTTRSPKSTTIPPTSVITRFPKSTTIPPTLTTTPPTSVITYVSN